MATVQRPTERYLDFDEYVDFQLEKARNGIKWTDILAAAAGVSALLIGYVVLFVIADHWLFEGGVPGSVRLVGFGAVVLVSLGWIGWRVVWPYVRRVNELYAARMLEEAEPSLRGNLFGLVDSRRSGRPPADEVRRALEKRAATTLSNVDIESAVDRRPLMRTAYVLLVVVLVACAYAVLSPKRVAPSLMRALLPSSEIGVATRTEIVEVRPGDASVLAGTELDVSVMIRGEAPDKVTLYYSTADRRFANEPVEMRLHDETTREYRAILVGDAGRGLTQDLSYRIEANDDAAGPFAIVVEQPPAATVTNVVLQHPPYTRLEPIESETAAIDAIEGTNVTLEAKANRKLKSAKIVFADDERFLARGEEVPMRVGKDDESLAASWRLAIRSDGSSPTHYRIECRDTDGKTNPNPVVHRITIRPDQPPEVILHDPKSDLERPANAIIPLLVTARDPDFRLRELTLRIEKDGQPLPERTVLWEGSQSEAAVRHNWDLAPLALKPGDVISYYVQARDNREPEFNRRNTPKLNITITEPVTNEEVERQLEQDRQRQDEQIAEATENEAAADRAADGPAESQGDQRQEQAASDSSETGDGDDSATGENQPQDEARPPTGADESRGEKQSSPVKNDGSQDDVVLRRLLERTRENQEQPSPDEQTKSEPQDQQAPPDDRAGASQSAERTPGGSGKQPPNQEQPQDGNQRGSSQTQTKSGSSSGQESFDDGASAPTQPSGDGQNKAPGQSKTPGQPSDAPQGDRTEDSTRGERDRGRENGDASDSPLPTSPIGQGSPKAGSDSSADSTDAGPSDGDPQKNGNRATKSADGERTGEQPRQTGESDETPTAADADRMASDPTKPRPNDGGPSATDRDPGEANPDQRSEKPDSGEKGAGQPNADGDPDGRPGPGDSGTRPGTQQPSDQRRGDTGNAAQQQGTGDNQPQPGQSKPGDASQGDSRGQQNNDGSQEPLSPSQQSQSGQPQQSEPGSPSETSGQQGRQEQSRSESQPGQQSSSESSQNQANGERSSSNDQSTEPQSSSKSPSGQSAENDASSKEPMQESSEGSDGQQNQNGRQGQSEEQGERGQQGQQQTDQDGQRGQQKGQQGGQGQNGQQFGQPGKGEAGQGSQQGQGGQSSGQSKGENGQSSGQTPGNGGATGGQSEGGSGGAHSDAIDGPEAANPEHAKQATDLVLKKLEDDLRRGEVDQDLLKDLGWTEEDMRRFADRLRKNLAQPAGDETPQEAAARKEFEHMLERLPIGEGSAARTAPRDRVRNVEGVGTVNPAVPAEYRDAFEAFTRRVAGRRAAGGSEK